MFKWILDASLRNRMLALAAAAVLLVLGALQLTRTPVDVFPDLNRPTVTLMTEAGGMAPEEVEQLISFPLETAMNGLPGVETVRSVSSAGLSFVYAGRLEEAEGEHDEDRHVEHHQSPQAIRRSRVLHGLSPCRSFVQCPGQWLRRHHRGRHDHHGLCA